MRERNREKYFQQFVEPLYKDAEAVVNDYVALFGELIELLKKAIRRKKLLLGSSCDG